MADDGRRMQIELGQDQGQGQDQVTSGSRKQTWKGRAGQGSFQKTGSGQVRSGHIDTLDGRGLALKVKDKVMEDRKEDAGQGKGCQGEGVFCSVLFLVPAIRTSKTVPNLANTSSRSFLVV